MDSDDMMMLIDERTEQLNERLLRAETIIAVLQRALGWLNVSSEGDEGHFILNHVVYEVRKTKIVADVVLTDSERNILESGNE